jgi:hypothetical protein
MENQDQTDPKTDSGCEPVSQSHVYRDHIVDRTGELLSRAVEVARDFPKSTIGNIAEPLTGVTALVTIGADGVKAIPASTFDTYRFAPRERTGVARVTRLRSFIDHVNRFKTSDSAVFANESDATPQLVAVLDYHESVNEGEGDDAVTKLDAQPRFGRHRTAFCFPMSDEWKAWTGASGTLMGMVDFAKFLEDNIVNVQAVDAATQFSEALTAFIATVPNSTMASPTKLMALATGLKVNEASTVQEVRNLSSGEGQVKFTSEHRDDAGGQLKVPGLFIIAIPVFAASNDLYRIAARLRYRKTPDGIVFWYDLWRTDLVFKHAFDEACEQVIEETALPLFYGSPEA